MRGRWLKLRFRVVSTIGQWGTKPAIKKEGRRDCGRGKKIRGKLS